MTARDYDEALAQEVARRRDLRVQQLLVVMPLDAPVEQEEDIDAQ
jgi:hypothetical protein